MAECNKRLSECRVTWVNKRFKWSNTGRDFVKLREIYQCRLNKIDIQRLHQKNLVQIALISAETSQQCKSALNNKTSNQLSNLKRMKTSSMITLSFTRKTSRIRKDQTKQALKLRISSVSLMERKLRTASQRMKCSDNKLGLVIWRTCLNQRRKESSRKIEHQRKWVDREIKIWLSIKISWEKSRRNSKALREASMSCTTRVRTLGKISIKSKMRSMD